MPSHAEEVDRRTPPRGADCPTRRSPLIRRILARLYWSAWGFNKLRILSLLRLPWIVANVEDWPAQLGHLLFSRPVTSLRMRDRTTFTFLTPMPEVVVETYCMHVYTPPHAISPWGVVVDVGANVGIFSIYAAQRLVPQGRVLSLEPNPRCIEVLKRNLAANHIGSVEVRAGALGARGGMVQLHIDVRDSGGSTIYGSRNGPAFEVPLLSPVELLSWAPRIDLLKLDCEGGEHPLICATSSEDWRNVQSVVAEYHLHFGTGYPSDGDASLLAERLRGFGFTAHVKPFTRNYGYLVAYRPPAPTA